MMKPSKMWRVEHPIDSGQRGTLAICKNDEGMLASVFVRDGKGDKDTMNIYTFLRDQDVITTYGPGGPVNYRRLAPIPVTEGIERVNMVVASASVNPNAKAR